MSVGRGLPQLPAEVPDFTDDVRTAAQRTVASFSTDAAECRIFLAMLGIGQQDSDDLLVEVWPTPFDT